MRPRPQEVATRHTGNRKVAGMFTVIPGFAGQRHSSIQHNRQSEWL